MEWLEKMNSAIEYIEDNLTESIDMKIIARKAGCSEYHFTRMFSFIISIPLSEYIRRRKLSMAAFELKTNDIKIIDLAHKYDYASPNSFTHAFKEMHGVTPSAARETGVELKSYPRITFNISIKGDTSLNYLIVEKEAFSVFGVSRKVSRINGKCYKEIPEFIDECEDKRITNKIVEAGYGDKETLLNALIYDKRADDTFRYMICMDLPGQGVSEEFEIQHVPAQKWVVFPLELPSTDGPLSIQSIWKRVYTEWFPYSGYEHAAAPAQERLYRTEDGRIIVEAWVPIIKSYDRKE